MEEKLRLHQELCRELSEVYQKKNTAYGDSFGKSFRDWVVTAYGDSFGKSFRDWVVTAAAVRLEDKFNRFINLARHPEIDPGDEQITDTLMDMANYCLMTCVELEVQKK